MFKATLRRTDNGAETVWTTGETQTQVIEKVEAMITALEAQGCKFYPNDSTMFNEWVVFDANGVEYGLLSVEACNNLLQGLAFRSFETMSLEELTEIRKVTLGYGGYNVYPTVMAEIDNAMAHQAEREIVALMYGSKA